jgi:hypothetical protein
MLRRFAPGKGGTVRMSPQEQEEFLDKIFAHPTPPHQLIAFGFVKLLKQRPGEIKANLSNTPLRELGQKLEDEYLKTSQLPEDPVRSCFQPLCVTMDRRLDEAVKNKQARRIYAALLDRIVGETSLRDYYRGSPEENILRWCDAVEEALLEAPLIDRAKQGDREAFDELYVRHNERVDGFIRARTDNKKETEDVSQETKLSVWQKIPTYDPALGSFRAFVYYWAGKMLLRHYYA